MEKEKVVKSSNGSSAPSPEKSVKKKVIKKVIKHEPEEEPKKIVKKKVVKKVVKKVTPSHVDYDDSDMELAGPVNEPITAPTPGKEQVVPAQQAQAQPQPAQGQMPVGQTPANAANIAQPQAVSQGVTQVVPQMVQGQVPAQQVAKPAMNVQPQMPVAQPQPQQMMNQGMATPGVQNGPVMPQMAKPVVPMNQGMQTGMPVQQMQPQQMVKPAMPMQPQMQSAMPQMAPPQMAKPAVPMNQGMPVQMPQQMQPQQMVKPAVPASQPVQMAQPQPAKPVQPVVPQQPEVQAKPVVPAQPQAAAQPQKPAQPQVSAQPAAQPQKPAAPVQPEPQKPVETKPAPVEQKSATEAAPVVKKEEAKSTSIFEPIRYTHVPSVKLLNVSFKSTENFLNSNTPVAGAKKEEPAPEVKSEEKANNEPIKTEEPKQEESKKVEEEKKVETPEVKPTPEEVKPSSEPVKPESVTPTPQPQQPENKPKPMPLSALQGEVQQNMNQHASAPNMNQQMQMQRNGQMMNGKVVTRTPIIVQQPVIYQPVVMGYQPVQYPNQTNQHVNMPGLTHQNVVPGPPQGNNMTMNNQRSQVKPVLTPEQRLEQELAPDPKPFKPVNNTPVKNDDKELLDKIKRDVNEPNKPQSLNDVLRTSLDSEKDVLKTDEDDLLSQFVYNNPNRIITGKINFAAILFGPFYYMYRKLLLIGLLDFTVVLGLLYYNLLYYAIGAWVVMGILFKYIYLTKGRGVVRSVMKKKPKGDSYELSRMCQKRGGTSFGYVLAGLMAEIAVLLVIGYLLVGATFFSTLSKFLKSYNFEKGGFDFKILKQLIDDSKPSDEDKYKEIQSIKLVPDTNYDVTQKFEITVPETFENRSNKVYQFRYFDPKTSNSGCSINMYAVSNYKDDNEFIQDIESTDGNSVAAKKTINKIPWQFYVINSDRGNEYFYVTYLKDDGKTIILKYEAQINSDGECEKQRESIIETIKIK